MSECHILAVIELVTVNRFTSSFSFVADTCICCWTSTKDLRVKLVETRAVQSWDAEPTPDVAQVGAVQVARLDR